MKLHKISDHVYANWDGETGGNVGIIVLEDKVLAVDAQYPGSAKKFREAIHNITDKPITHLLLTHVHGDHVWGNQVFEDTNIVSHVRLKEKMSKSLLEEWAPKNLTSLLDTYREASPERWWLFDGLRIVLPTTTFKTLYEIDDVQFIHSGGHTDCSSIVHVPEDKVIFAGDLLFVGRYPWAGDPTVNPTAWIEAFEKILGLDAEKIVSGHGPLCDNKEVKAQLKWFKDIRYMMMGMIADGIPVDEAVEYKFPELYPSDRPESQKIGYRRWYTILGG
jgi:glyoxylase-like metal-dependent hydrolase (beta-lactamase superfamily II)